MPAFTEAYRVLKQDHLMISFYGWTQVDKFFHAWRKAGFRIVGHLVFREQYASKARFLLYRHEQAYLLAKGNPALPEHPIPDVIDIPYPGNKLHPTQKPIAALKPLIESLLPGAGSDPRSTLWFRFNATVGKDPQPPLSRHRARSSVPCSRCQAAAPWGHRGLEEVYTPRSVQTSRPVPPVGDALQSSLAL